MIICKNTVSYFSFEYEYWIETTIELFLFYSFLLQISDIY